VVRIDAVIPIDLPRPLNLPHHQLTRPRGLATIYGGKDLCQPFDPRPLANGGEFMPYIAPNADRVAGKYLALDNAAFWQLTADAKTAFNDKCRVMKIVCVPKRALAMPQLIRPAEDVAKPINQFNH
jgi:hypothetical protein